MKTILKLLLIPFALLLLLFLCAIVWIWPTTKAVTEVPSPDGRFVARVETESAGGALGSIITYVTLEDRQRKSGWPFSSYEKNHVLKSWHYLDVALSWKDEMTLEVAYRSSYTNAIAYREEQWKDVRIIYREVKSVSSRAARP